MKMQSFLFFTLSAIALGCTEDSITEIENEQEVSVDCSAVNADVKVLQILAQEKTAGSTVAGIDGSKITFSSGNEAEITVRTAYSFSNANPTISVGDSNWIVDGASVDSEFATELLQLKGASGYWYLYYGNEWNRIYSIVEGSSVPVFCSLDSDADSVYVGLSDGNTMSFPMYKGNETISLSESSLTIPQEGGEVQMTVTSSSDWNAVTDAEWIGFTPQTGVSGAVTVTVTSSTNDSYSRTGYITFSNSEVSCKVKVTQDGESGGGIIESSDTEETEDNVSKTEFDRTIRVVYSEDGAEVSGDTYGIVSVSANDVTVNNTTEEKIIFELSGTAQDGFFKVYNAKKQAIVLNGLTLTNKSGAAINNQGKKRCFVVVNGTNTLSDGSSYSDTPSSEDEKATLFSEGQIIFSGSGTLTVNAVGKAGITSDDYVRFMSSPTVTVNSSAGHGIRGKDAVIVSNGLVNATVSANMKKGLTSDSLICIDGGVTTVKITGSAAYDSDDGEYTGTAGVKADQLFEINGGTLTVTNSGTGGKGISGDGKGYFNGGTVKVTVTGSNYGSSSQWGSSSNSVSAKGIKFDDNLYFNGATVSVSCKSHEGIESKGTITVADGVVYSYSASDDGINSSGTFTIEGGMVCGYAPGNDGLDANGNFYIKGGLVYAIGKSSPEVAIDANTEGGYKLYVQGGTLIAIGGLESGASLTQSCYQASSWSKSTWYSITVGSEEYAFKTPSSAGSPLVVSGSSTPTLKSGVTVSGGTSLFEGMLTTGATVSGGSSVTLSTYSGGNGGFGPGGGGKGGSYPPGFSDMPGRRSGPGMPPFRGPVFLMLEDNMTRPENYCLT